MNEVGSKDHKQYEIHTTHYTVVNRLKWGYLLISETNNDIQYNFELQKKLISLIIITMMCTMMYLII